MEKPYQKLLTAPIDHVAEKKQEYHCFTERHVQAIWFGQQYFTNLTTDLGLCIEVISPGLWNVEAGPDFKKAHLKIGTHEYFGDIEIHLTDQSWEDHQHHLDDRYNQVILHISLWKPKNPQTVMTKSGKIIQKIYLEDFLTIPIARISHLIDLDLYPYKTFHGSGHCSHLLFQQLPSFEIQQFFEKAADWRLLKKRQSLKQRVENPILYAGSGIAMALGYKNNSEVFLDLFLKLQTMTFCTENERLAWLMAQCGFFDPYFIAKWGKNPFYMSLKDHASAFLTEKKFTLSLHQIRPLNHPVRRLVLLAKMHQDDMIKLLYGKILFEWSTHWRDCLKINKWKGLLEAFTNLLPTYVDSYWNQHYLFEENESPVFLTLFGNDLKRTMIINTFLPLLQESVLKRGFHDEMEAFQSFYRALPASKAGKNKYLSHRFFGNSPKSNVLANAYAEQGALQLHYDFCSHFEASCSGCPFVERYKQTFQKA